MKKLISKESWIGGVSDGLILPCSICGIENIQFDYSVNNDLWQKVVPKEYILSVVCLPCLDKLAKKAGLNIGDHIETLQFIGINETIEFIPSNIFYYNRDKE